MDTVNVVDAPAIANVWPGLEDEVEIRRRQIHASSTTETAIRPKFPPEAHLAAQPNGDGRLLDKFGELTLEQHEMPTEIVNELGIQMEEVLTNDNATSEEKGDAHWYLAQRNIDTDQQKARHHCLAAGKLGHENGRVNYLYRCLRDSVVVTLKRRDHLQWLLESLTGPQVFKALGADTSTTVRQRLRNGLSKFLPMTPSKRRLAVFHEAFVHDVLGSSFAPHDRIFSEDRWKSIITGKEATFEKIPQGLSSMCSDLLSNVLHDTALYGTGDDVQDLVKRNDIDLERKAETESIYGTALQAAFLRHNMQTVQTLMNLGADILTLFSEEVLEVFLVEGDRGTLHWLHHLIPLMSNHLNREQAQGRFESVLISSSALRELVIHRNWSL